MKWFYDLKIASKLIASFVALLALTAFMGVFSIIQLSDVNDTGTELAENWLPSTRAAQGMRFYTAEYRLQEAQHIYAQTAEQMKHREQLASAAIEGLERNRATLVELISSPEERSSYEAFEMTWTAYLSLSETLLDISNQQLTEEARALFAGKSRETFDATFAAIQQIVDLNSAGAAAASVRGDELYAAARFAIISVLIATIIVGLMLALFISRIISRPLKIAAHIASQLAEGDFTTKIEVSSKDETGLLLTALQNMVGKLSQVVAQVRNSADNLASASEEVSATAQSMSQATSEQAASVEETSASIEQMSASINQNTENAKVTDGMASKAAKEATEGGEAVQQTVSAMKQIAQRISIIDDIAYQTNLLALNAAIEAARAGEHGKGFAVVAAEVRKLAERSQVAAQEIGELSSSSVELAEKAGKLLDAMVPSINKTSDLVQEISAASEEQASGVGQINTAMTQLNQITQQNASSSEELAATSEEMSSQAEQLQQAMSFFTVGAPSGNQPAATRPAPAAGRPQSRIPVQPNTASGKYAASNPADSEFTRF